MDVAFIGGGALSLFSAYFLSKHHNLNITVYEKNAKVGRKLTNSGNGRGNFSNMYVAVNKYNNEAFVAPLINAFTPKDFIAEVASLGLLTYADEQGRIYPLSEQGIVFNELLLNHLNKHNVSIKENTEVKTLKKQGSKFIVNEVDEYDYVIFATGSNAGLGKNLQSKTPVSILNALGHTFIPYTPTLASIGVKENIHSINGRRNKADLKLIINDKEVYTNSGEVLFRKDALSGIAIFELSSILAWEKLKNPNLSAKISLDLLP
ncbi:MAG: NAD(P)-binding protein, partial [Erysipelotrichaceae bacterium]|nr:NAD(P)-binding protein [Erysipelotrichaceae bacterium]